MLARQTDIMCSSNMIVFTLDYCIHGVLLLVIMCVKCMHIYIVVVTIVNKYQ